MPPKPDPQYKPCNFPYTKLPNYPIYVWRVSFKDLCVVCVCVCVSACLRVVWDFDKVKRSDPIEEEKTNLHTLRVCQLPVKIPANTPASLLRRRLQFGKSLILFSPIIC